MNYTRLKAAFYIWSILCGNDSVPSSPDEYYWKERQILLENVDVAEPHCKMLQRIVKLLSCWYALQVSIFPDHISQFNFDPLGWSAHSLLPVQAKQANQSKRFPALLGKKSVKYVS